MPNTTISRTLNNSLSQKLNTKNPTCHSNTNLGQSFSAHRPFSRKPINLTEHSSFKNILPEEKQIRTSLAQAQILDTQSVISAGYSFKQTKFVRTNKMAFLSPKNKNLSRQQSFSSRNLFGTQSVIIEGQPNKVGKSSKRQYYKKQQRVSQVCQQQNQNYLRRSISSENLWAMSNSTKSCINQKLNKKAQIRINKKESKNQFQTSLCAAYVKGQMQEINKLQRQQINTKNKSIFTNILVEQESFSKEINKQQDPKSQNCNKCEEKQKSNKEQVSYFQTIIKKQQIEISYLKNKEYQYKLQNSQLSLFLQQNQIKLSQLLQNQKLSIQTEQKLQLCINQLKQELAQLKNQLRYLKIQNTVLLKIKNQNLKLKIDITKIQDQKDYFKMKLLEINKKKRNTEPQYNSHQNNSKNKFDSFKKISEFQKSKTFYLDSTETQEMDCFDEDLKKHKNKQKNFDNIASNSSDRISQTEKNNVVEILFNLTSEDSQNSL